MRKSFTIASVVSLCAVPMLLPSKDASAIPAFARKYGTSCYTCHSGFPNRNAFGEAFKNNGYRWPGGEDEEKSKQEQLKMGADGWKKTFPSSPWPAEIPGYAPISLWVRGNLLEYAQSSVTRGNSALASTANKEKMQWGTGVFNTATIFFGGTMGDNLSTLVQYSPTVGATTGQLVWNFKPGLKLSLGNGFTDLNFGNANTAGNAFVSALVPAFGNGTGSTVAELVYIPKDYFKLSAGVGQAGTALQNSFTDSKYVRAKYKIGGAGLLSGAGGTYGNEFVGLDNNITIAGMVFGAAPGTASGNFVDNFVTERLILETDISGNYGNFTGTVGYSRSTNLGKDNYKADASYFLYPWLKASVTYTSIKQAENPTLAFGLTTHLRANAYLTATYTRFSRQWPSPNPTAISDPSPNTIKSTFAATASNANTVVLTGGFAF